MSKFTRFTPTTLNEDQLYLNFDNYGMDSSRTKMKKDKTGSEKKSSKGGAKSSTIKNETISEPSASRRRVDDNDRGKYGDKLPKEKAPKKRKLTHPMILDEAEEDNGNYDDEGESEGEGEGDDNVTDNESGQGKSERSNDSETEEEKETKKKKKKKKKKGIVNSDEEDDDDEETTATKSHGSRHTHERMIALHKSNNSSKNTRKRDHSRDRHDDSTDRYSSDKKIRSSGGAQSRERDHGDNQRDKSTTQSPKTHRVEDDTLINNETVGELMKKLWFSNKDMDNQMAIKSQIDEKFIGSAPAFSLGSTIDISPRRSTYALLARFNIKKILSEFCLLEETMPKQCEDVTQIVFGIHRTLWRLGNFAKKYNIEIDFPEQSLQELAVQFEEGEQTTTTITTNTAAATTTATTTTTTTTTTDEDEHGHEHNLEDQIRENDPNKKQKINMCLYDLIGTLDKYVRLFLACAAMRRMTDYRTHLKKAVHFSALNFIYNDVHRDYLMNKIFFQKYDEANDHYKLNGYFLISVELSKRKLKYPAFIERNYHLASVVREYIRGPLFKHKVPNNVKIYVNISMKQNCADFNVCDPLSAAELKLFNDSKDLKIESPNKIPAHVDQSGVLALVEIAFAKLDVEKKCISVKAYIVSTYSSIGATKS